MIVDMRVHYYLPAFVEAIRSSDAFETYIRDDGRLVVLLDALDRLALPADERVDLLGARGLRVLDGAYG